MPNKALQPTPPPPLRCGSGRAFHLAAIDSLLHQYGLFTKFRKETFPEKVRLIDAVGMIPIGIMTNLNVERNLLEHDRVAVPPKTQVKEAVDVTKLLLLATEKLVEATPHEVVMGWAKPSKTTPSHAT